MRHSHAVRVPETETAAGDAGPPSRAAEPFDPATGTTDPAAAGSAESREAHAVTVETIFAGTSTATRLLPAARETARAATSRRYLAGGAALIGLALAMFAAAAIDAADERRALGAWTASGHEPGAFVWRTGPRAAGLLDVLFVAGLLGGGTLVALGLHRRSDDRRRFRRAFSIGATAAADAPVDPAYLAPAESGSTSSRASVPAHDLVIPSGGDYLIHPTPRMAGLVESGGQTYALTELGVEPGAPFRLPPGARARLSCGRTTFVIRSIQRPTPLAGPRRGPSPAELPYTIGAAVALGLLVLMIFTIPPDPRSLSLDLLGVEPHLISFNIMPPTIAESRLPAWIGAGGGPSAGTPAAGPSGASGDEFIKKHERRRAQSGTPSRPVTEAESRERAGNAGILGILKDTRRSKLDGVLAPGSGLVDLIGNLQGSQVGSAWGAGGLDTIGTGAGGGGTGETLAGAGGLKTLGSGGGTVGGSAYGHGVGRLGARRPKAPEVIPGSSTVRGSLDKEIVRRIIHRHLNEVRFCYEEELRKQPTLGGRVGVQFTISNTGQVITSVLQSSTLANRAVENCTVNAVRRWQFPQPQGGGLVMVSYPFLFARPE